MVGERLCVLDERRKGFDDLSASVAGCADDEDCGCHCVEMGKLGGAWELLDKEG